MGKYIDRAKRISLPPDNLGHYDFIEGYGMAKSQMMTLLGEADQEIEDLTNQLEGIKQILKNSTKKVKNG